MSRTRLCLDLVRWLRAACTTQSAVRRLEECEQRPALGRAECLGELGLHCGQKLRLELPPGHAQPTLGLSEADASARLIHALMVTRLVLASSAAPSVDTMSSAARRALRAARPVLSRARVS